MKTKLPIPKQTPKGKTPIFPKPGKDLTVNLPALEGTPAATPPPAPPRPVFDPMHSVGHQLMQARQARFLSIEDVSFETRIPHQLLRDMENDDLSNFANLTYAKGFLKLYSRYLDLDLHDYLDEFDTSIISDATSHEWSRVANIVGSLSAPAIAPDAAGRSIPGLAGIGALAAVLVIGGFIFFKTRPPEPAAASSPTAAAETANTPSTGPADLVATTTPAAQKPSAAPAPPGGGVVLRATVVEEETTIPVVAPVPN